MCMNYDIQICPSDCYSFLLCIKRSSGEECWNVLACRYVWTGLEEFTSLTGKILLHAHNKW